MNSQSKHPLDEQSLEAARRCFREAVAWGCEPEDALPSAIAAYLDLLAARAEGTLIAAAPDMLAALKEAFETLTSRDACDLAPIVGSDNPHEHAAGLVQAAISRAEGKAS